ncbi:MAG TPA: hypothetical protein PL019_09075 [Caldisericia bacterium]|nr:hypothetical protein [Caldisericia bacterium]
MKFKTFAFPFEIFNGSLRVVEGYEDCVREELEFVILSTKGSIPAFPNLGAAPDPFALPQDQYFGAELTEAIDIIQEQIERHIPQIDKAKVELSWTEENILQLDIYYTLKNGDEGHYSTNYYTVEES